MRRKFYIFPFMEISLLLSCFIRLHCSANEATLLNRLRDLEKVFFTRITPETMKKVKNHILVPTEELQEVAIAVQRELLRTVIIVNILCATLKACLQL